MQHCPSHAADSPRPAAAHHRGFLSLPAPCTHPAPRNSKESDGFGASWAANTTFFPEEVTDICCAHVLLVPDKDPPRDLDQQRLHAARTCCKHRLVSGSSMPRRCYWGKSLFPPQVLQHCQLREQQSNRHMGFGYLGWLQVSARSTGGICCCRSSLAWRCYTCPRPLQIQSCQAVARLAGERAKGKLSTF